MDLGGEIQSNKANIEWVISLLNYYISFIGGWILIYA
jgi:hypothetical protein